MIANRDYAMTVRKQPLDGGACRVRFKVPNEAAPARPDGFVRMENVWGGWLFEPGPGEQTRVTNFLYADPAGDVPPFLVHGGQKVSAMQSVLLAQARVKAAHRTQQAPARVAK